MKHRLPLLGFPCFGLLTACLLSSADAEARPLNFPTLSRLFADSDLVAVIRPKATERTSDQLTSAGPAYGPRDPANYQGFNTRCKVLDIVKAAGRASDFKGDGVTILHFAYIGGPLEGDGAQVIYFHLPPAQFVTLPFHGDMKARLPQTLATDRTVARGDATYLAFLRQREDGRFEPVTGTYDSAFSFKILGDVFSHSLFYADMGIYRQPVVSRLHTVSIHTYGDQDYEAVLHLLRDELQLPLIWGPSKYGDNTYTGFWAGNAYLEPVGHPLHGPDHPSIRFFGLTFNPSWSAEISALELDRRGIAYRKPTAWSSSSDHPNLIFVPITDLSSDKLGVSLMEETDSAGVKEEERVNSERLEASGGGPLAVQAIQEVLVGETAERIEKWRRLLRDPRFGPESDKAWNPLTGPLIRFLPEDQKPGIKSVTLRVKSLDTAARYLESRKMLGRREPGMIELAREKTLGLSIRLSE